MSYETDSGPVTYTGDWDFSGGAGPSDATRLGDADNISVFQAAGSGLGTFGRRTAPILITDPTAPPTLRPNESLITHALFKINNDDVFFPAFAGGPEGDVTVTFDNIHFAQPVVMLEDTLMVHVRWTAEQADQAYYLTNEIYIFLEDHHTVTDPFRDFDVFYGRLFFDIPTPNYVLADPDVDWTMTGNGTDTLSLSVTFPYDLLKNLEATVDLPPSELPAPEGFLEPFHFHSGVRGCPGHLVPKRR